MAIYWGRCPGGLLLPIGNWKKITFSLEFQQKLGGKRLNRRRKMRGIQKKIVSNSYDNSKWVKNDVLGRKKFFWQKVMF